MKDKQICKGEKVTKELADITEEEEDMTTQSM
jgi:hypothetical protein